MKPEVMNLFQSLATGNLESVGTLADFVGKGGKIRFNESNLADVSKTVMLDITTATGVRGRLFASQNVGTQIRAKALTLPQLLGLRVVQGTTKDGSAILRLIGWESNGLELVVNDITTEQAQGAVTTIADLSALGGL
jgi:hypothetical protein